MTTMLQAEKKSNRIWAIVAFILEIGLTIAVFNAGPKDISTWSTIAFLLSRSWLWIIVFIAWIVWTAIVLYAVIKQKDWTDSNYWPYITLIAICGFALATIGFNRNACKEDVNVSARYQEFIKTK